MKNISCKSFAIFLFILFVSKAGAQDFVIHNKNEAACIVYDPNEATIDSITAFLLAKDIERVTGYLPKVYSSLASAKGNVIAIGSYKSGLIREICGKQYNSYNKLASQWECYLLKLLASPHKNIRNALIIAGSDARGTAYGVFSISEKIGVSPWYWWADVPVSHKDELVINQKEYFSTTPSVKYRGIFLNDEDWGLQPWAAKTFEPETGDIGPKTYSKIFELLLRLKANLIWPAMHPSTKAFYFYEKNKQVAADYSIIIGSSHAEPMLRNNVGEWNTRTMGPFNYITNQQTVYKYWEDRVKESRINDVIYTLGMRGVHDSGIEGVKGPKEAVPLLSRIIADQRALLTRYINPDITKIPQVFTAYKEVLDIYDNGLSLPDDVTLVWPDDNYGYIQRLNNEVEQKRGGGAGVYYHASYWGRPHDYLWLSSTHPALIREEMMKAFSKKVDRLWVLNVGDIKPLEYNIQLFLDMAYNVKPFSDSRYVKIHLQNWYTKIFGPGKGNKIAGMMWDYYQLAFERRPEFMGWSQTEPTTKTHYSAYNHFSFGDEAQQRIDKYEALEKQAQSLRAQIGSNDADAFYQLVYYPVICASLMNKKFLYRDKAYLYNIQGRISARDYAVLSSDSYSKIIAETDYYNNELSNGKWKYIMSMQPRSLPVYQAPVLPDLSHHQLTGWNIAPEGLNVKDSVISSSMTLPAFTPWGEKSYFIDIFLCDSETIKWSASADDWIKLSKYRGVLNPENNELRILVSIDWNKLPRKEIQKGKIVFTGGNKEFIVDIPVSQPTTTGLNNYKGAVETNGYISLFATHFTKKKDNKDAKWIIYRNIGHTGNSLMAETRDHYSSLADSNATRKNAAYAAYNIYTFTAIAPEISLFTLPIHPIDNQHSMRYAISVDDGPLHVVDFRTFGRSEEWKQNVLGNNAERKITLEFLNPGKHVLKIYMIDPGVILDRFLIDLGGLQDGYGVIPETVK